MKKIITIAVIALSVLACHRKTAPAADATPTVDVAAAEKAKADAAAHTEMVASGKTVYTNRCGRCHALKNVESYTAKSWEGILKSMIPKAKLNETEGSQVTAYVMEHAKK